MLPTQILAISVIAMDNLTVQQGVIRSDRAVTGTHQECQIMPTFSAQLLYSQETHGSIYERNNLRMEDGQRMIERSNHSQNEIESIGPIKHCRTTTLQQQGVL